MSDSERSRESEEDEKRKKSDDDASDEEGSDNEDSEKDEEQGKKGKDKDGKGKEGKGKGKDGKGKEDKKPKDEGKDEEEDNNNKAKDKKKDKKGKAAKAVGDEMPASPRGNTSISTDKVSIAFKIADLATEFAKNSSEILRSLNDNKPKALPKIAKKLSPTLLTKLMKPTSKDPDFDRRFASLEEFARVTEELQGLLVTASKTFDDKRGTDDKRTSSVSLGPLPAGTSLFDPQVVEEINQRIEDGHMFLSVVLQKEIAAIVAIHNEDKKVITAVTLSRLLTQAHTYSKQVNTMKFPDEWESILEEVNPKYKKGKEKEGDKDKEKEKDKDKEKKGTKNTVKSPEAKKDVKKEQQQASPQKAKSEDRRDDKKPPKTEENSSEFDDEDTQTVQIEIRGNTGGFVGSVIEFDLVVTHEDGMPVKVDATAFDVEISGPASKSKVNIWSKGEGAFRIEFTPEEEGPNTLSIFMHEMLLTSGIRSVISRAGELAFLVHGKDLSRGQLQGISVVPSSLPGGVSKRAILNLKLAGISQCEEMLRDLRAKFEQELKDLGED